MILAIVRRGPRVVKCARCGATWSYPAAGLTCPACSCDRFSFVQETPNGPTPIPY